MNFMGIGFMELVVILLVGFLVLGPGRSIDMARKSGKMLGDLRRTFSEVTDAISVEESQRVHSQQPPPGVPTRPDVPDNDYADGDTSGSSGAMTGTERPDDRS